MAQPPRRPADMILPPRAPSPLPDEEGEEVELPDDPDAEIEDTEDGGAMVSLGGADSPGGQFYDNLAVTLTPELRQKLATDVADWVRTDKESRKQRDQKYAEGLQRTGLGDDAPGGATFEGASKVVHPMLVEAAVDFAARAIKELFPPGGPAKDFIFGTVTREKVAKAKRKSRHLNWQLTVQMREFRSELEQALTQVPIGGVQYIKLGWDEAKAQIITSYVPVDDVYLPYAATNFYTAERKIHRQEVSAQEYARRVASAMYYVPNPAPPASGAEDQSAAAKASAKIEGKTDEPPPETSSVDGPRVVYEVCCYRDDIEGREGLTVKTDGNREIDGANLLPYIITVEQGGTEIIGVYRNWEEQDARRNEMLWMIELPFIPWRGAYPIGLTHLIGGLSGAATGALRALLDSGLIANFPGALKGKTPGGGRGQNVSINPTQINEIDGSPLGDDIRKSVYPIPFTGPSATLFQLLGFLVEAGRGVVRTTFEDLANQKQDLPVGTALTLIEQGLTVYSAIHGRLHDAIRRMLEVMCRINRMYLDDGDVLDETGELLARREDYEGPADVIPVSDPHVFSEVQRFAQIQAVVARADAHPDMYDSRAVEKRLLERLRIPQPEELLQRVQEPKRMNAVGENLMAVMARPIVALPEQDHLAHLQTHLSFMASPFFGSNLLIAPAFLPIMLAHVKEHVALWYVASIYKSVERVTNMPPEKLMTDDPRVSAEFDKLLAAASNKIIPIGAKVFAQLPPVIAQAMQLLQTLRPPPPQDPTVAAATAARAETDRKAVADRAKDARDAAKLQLDREKAVRDAATQVQVALQKLQDAKEKRAHETELEQLRQMAADRRSQFEMAMREAMNLADNQTAKELAMLEVMTNEKFDVTTGTGVNPGPG